MDDVLRNSIALSLIVIDDERFSIVALLLLSYAELPDVRNEDAPRSSLVKRRITMTIGFVYRVYHVRRAVLRTVEYLQRSR